MGREDPHFRLRIPADLKERIEAAASDTKRSLNAEIVARLEAYDRAQQALSDFDLAKERILHQQEIEKELRRQIDLLQKGSAMTSAGSVGGFEDIARTVSSMAEAIDRQAAREAELRDLISKLVEGSQDTNERQLRLLEQMSPIVDDVHRIIAFMASRPEGMVGSAEEDAGLTSDLGKRLGAAVDEYGRGLMTAVVVWMKDEGYIDATVQAAIVDDDGPILKAS